LALFGTRHFNPDSLSDEELLARIDRSNAHDRSFHALVNRYKEKLYRLLIRMLQVHEDADDALQTTFIRLWEKHDSFKGDSKLYTWLYRVASNEALMLLRKRSKMPMEDADELPDDAGATDLQVDGARASRLLNESLETLPPRQRAVFCLRYFEEIPYQEMARILEVSEGSLKASYHHAVKKISTYLQVHTR
jgi:RNA polymerase sigma-70 factor (ECF subfamily)